MAGFVFGDNLYSVHWYGASSFSGSMWFVPLCSTYGVSFGPLEVRYKTIRDFDSGWIEHFGDHGLYWVLSNLGKVNQWFQYNNLELFSGFFVTSIVILLFVLIYYLNSIPYEKKDWISYTPYRSKHISGIFNVYWTVHHPDSWIKRDQLDVTCFIISLFNAQNVSDVNTSILRSLRVICWVISWVVLLWFDGCWCYVVVWLGWCGIRIQAEALLEQYNPWNNSTNKSQAPEDGCINIRNMLSIKYWNKKQVTSSWSLFIQIFPGFFRMCEDSIKYDKPFTVKGKAITDMDRPWRFQNEEAGELAHEGGKVATPTHRPPLPTRKCPWYSFLLEAESTPVP